VSEQALHEAVHKYRRQHPNATDAEVIRHVAKHKVPGSIVGTPKWHAARLADLLAMVKQWGMPHFFLTLTAGDRCHNGDQWEEVRA
jgi:alkanesulfonate monooxygenase SsuD/methylene tetrahydromethanopterin reductase-like flavin-dependent oxidoreductase (luciferase family)